MTTRRRMLSFITAALLCTGAVENSAQAGEVLKVATLYPKASPWGQVFTVWEKAVKEKSGGRIELQFFYNGQHGDEAAMVAKMKAGQLDGAAVTSVGLSKIYKPILALEMPGLFLNWSKLDAARDAMKSEFEKGVSDAGFRMVGWHDVGLVHVMSKGFAVKTPEDIKGKKPFLWRDDIVQAVFYQVLGGVSSVPLNIPEVLPQLNTGAINIVTTSSLFGEQLQWVSKLDTVVSDVSGVSVGGLVFSTKRLDALPIDLRSILLDTGKVASSALTTRVRNEDSAAFTRIKGKMTNVTLNADDRAKWEALYKQIRQRLAQGTFDPALISKLESLAK